MVTLGITGLAHDSAVAIVDGGRLVFAVENERVTRRKGEWGFPDAAIRLAMSYCSLDARDIDRIAYYWDDRGTLPAALWAETKNIPQLGLIALSRAARRVRAAKSNSEVTGRLQRIWGQRPLPPVAFVDHHRSHAAYSFLASGFESAACLVVDGRGEYCTSSIYTCSGDNMDLLWQQPMPASLGYIYGAVTQHLGFEPLSDEYRVMGLAPFGDEDSELEQWFDRLVSLRAGKIAVDPSLISYQRDERIHAPWLDRKAEAVLGPPRGVGEAITPRHAAIAKALQKKYERILLELAEFAKRLTGERRLVLGGGCAMNSVANGKLHATELFEDVFVPAAPGDQGCAIGAAFLQFAYGDVRKFGREAASAFLGPAYCDDQIQAVLRRNKISFSEDRDGRRVASLIAGGQIGAIFDSRMEFGPRALGARSILADPRRADTKERLNDVVKMRESFRPFAGVVFNDRAHEYFERPIASPYMNVVLQVRMDARELIPAIVHVDHSCRIQTISRSEESAISRVLTTFEERTGVGILVNTSFNVKGEPIVMTPEDAIRCFYGTGLDFLMIGRVLIEKQ